MGPSGCGKIHPLEHTIGLLDDQMEQFYLLMELRLLDSMTQTSELESTI
jgi:ABC-type uncharacterized transport system YnjBCD ATPase subunit